MIAELFDTRSNDSFPHCFKKTDLKTLLFFISFTKTTDNKSMYSSKFDSTSKTEKDIWWQWSSALFSICCFVSNGKHDPFLGHLSNIVSPTSSDPKSICRLIWERINCMISLCEWGLFSMSCFNILHNSKIYYDWTESKRCHTARTVYSGTARSGVENLTSIVRIIFITDSSVSFSSYYIVY